MIVRGAGGFLYIASSAFLLALVVGIFWQNNMYYLIISVVGAILFSAYLLYDIQARTGAPQLVPNVGRAACAWFSGSACIPAEVDTQVCARAAVCHGWGLRA